MPLAEPRQGGQSVHSWQPDVEQNDVVRRAHDAIETGFAGIDGVDGIPLVAQNAAQRRAHAGFVVDDENGALHWLLRCRALG